MTYGNTYPREPKEEPPKPKSVIEALCNEAGYKRENLEGIELESKIDIEPRRRWFDLAKSVPLSLGEKINFPAPYSLDKVLDISDAFHECYGFVGESIVEAFTKVTKQGETKIKIKSETEYLTREGISLLKRREEHKKNMSSQELVSFIAQEARKSKVPLKYVGSFQKQSKEAFVFNPISGRIFVVATNLCKANLEDRGPLYQLELEYYGQINGYTHPDNIIEEMVLLTQSMINASSRLGYSGRSTKLTKFDWLAGNVR